MTAVARRIAPTRIAPTHLREVDLSRPAWRFIAEVIGDETGQRATVNAADFIDAAAVYLETGAVTIASEVLKVAVTDCETGLTHCFSLDFSSGEIKQS